MIDLVSIYLHQRDNMVDNNIYKNTQCDFAYNSNHIEGSQLTSDQTRMIFDQNRIVGSARVDDVIETNNHFALFDFMLDTCYEPLTHDYIKELHAILKNGTQQSRSEINAVGSYKLYENTIGELIPTTSPENVYPEMDILLFDYERKNDISINDIIDFHYKFEKIHPFSDGNGRIGRMVMFKECLSNNIMPFIITDDLRDFYVRGLQNYSEEKGYLVDTCLTAQDRYESIFYPLAISYQKTMETYTENFVDSERNEIDDDLEL